MEHAKIISYRNVWMGLAILWIMFYHADLNYQNVVLSDFKVFGYGGVDIFLLASGLGSYYSLVKDSDAYCFISRRIKRIIPTYLIFMIFWVSYHLYFHRITGVMAIGNILSVQQFTLNGGAFNWYIGAMWLLYFLAPYMYGFLRTHSSVVSIISIIMLLTLFSVPFWGNRELLIIISRLPIFFIGMLIGRTISERNMTYRDIVALDLVGIVGWIILIHTYHYRYDYMFEYGMWWYPFILITPGLCITVSMICELLENTIVGRCLVKGMSYIGQNTFELYLVHIFLFAEVENKIVNEEIVNSGALWIWVLAQVIVLAVVLKLLVKTCLYSCKKVLCRYAKK